MKKKKNIRKKYTRKKYTRKKYTRKKYTRKKNTRMENTKKKYSKNKYRKLKGGYTVHEGLAKILVEFINKTKVRRRKYEFGRMLGEGANSSVFSVSSNKTSYALKVTSMVHLPDERYDWKVLLDLLKEICILNVMKLSDYCVHVYDSVYY